MKNTNFQWFVKLLPTVGILFFLIFYIYASTLYPGGSQFNRNSDSFSWWGNYWCDLLRKKAYNGMPNISRPFAIASTFSLCFGVGIFYYLFPSHFMMRKFWRRVVKLLGVTSMIFAFFLFTDKHDIMLSIAGVLGIIALIGTLVALKRNNSFGLLWIGGICAFLVVVNNYMYYAATYIEFLPFIQKITTVFILIWIVGLNLVFFKTEET